jgi:RND family efflux transporter MFP subunit
LRINPRLWMLVSAAMLAAAVSQTACSHAEPPIQAKSAEAEENAGVVPVARIARANIASRTVLTAEFQPFQEVDLMAKVAGYVRSIKVDLGDQVREGQVLAELEVPEMTDEVAKAVALVEQTGSEIAAARDELQRAESAHQIAHLSYTRLQEVSKREPGLIPQQEVDEVRSRDLVSEAQVASARSKLRVEQNKTGVAKAEETRLRTLRNYVTITAPFAGTVTKRYANLGSMIQAGTASQSQAMPLVRLSQTSTLRLSLPVPESLVSGVRVGQPVEVQVKSLGRSFEGRVARFAGKVDQSTRTMITEVDVANPARMILPGMYAEVALQTKQHEGVLTAPLEAIERAGSSTRVYTVDKASAVKVVPVQLGVEDAARAEILSGLQESDLVIIGRRAGLNAGDKVKPKVLDSGR